MSRSVDLLAAVLTAVAGVERFEFSDAHSPEMRVGMDHAQGCLREAVVRSLEAAGVTTAVELMTHPRRYSAWIETAPVGRGASRIEAVIDLARQMEGRP